MYINLQNELTELQLQIPPLAKEARAISEENSNLQYEVEQFESPGHLMELAKKPEFGYLKHPLIKDIIVIPREKNPKEESK